MNIDSGNPLFRYIDKVIFAMAGAVALLALGYALWGSSRAAQIIAGVTQAMEDTGTAAESRQSAPPKDIKGFSRLSARFDPETIDEPIPFRLFVFFSPDEIIGDSMVVEYLKGSEKELDRYYITRRYGAKHPELKEVDYVKAKVMIIGPKNMATLSLDVEQKALIVDPRKAGTATVRVEFAEGPTFEFQLTITETVALDVAMPEPPLNLKATAHRGYVALTWETNPESCPGVSYNIHRADGPHADDKKVGEIKVDGRETAAVVKADGKKKEGQEEPELVLQKYGWDDFDVTPGTTYYYSIQTTGMVKEPDQQDAVLKPSGMSSDRAQATALSPFTVRLVMGTRGGTATFEVESQKRFVPHFRRFLAKPGQKIGNKEFGSGCMFVDIEQLTRECEEERYVPVMVDGKIVLQRKIVRYIKEELRAIIVNGNNEAVVKWKGRGRKAALQKRIRKLFKDMAELAGERLPKSKENKGTERTPQVTIANLSGRSTLTVAARGDRDRVILILEVPPNWSRTVEFPAGEYQLAAGYLVMGMDENDLQRIDPEKSKVFEAKKAKFKQYKQYRFEINRPKDKLVVAVKGAAPENK